MSSCPDLLHCRFLGNITFSEGIARMELTSNKVGAAALPAHNPLTPMLISVAFDKLNGFLPVLAPVLPSQKPS